MFSPITAHSVVRHRFTTHLQYLPFKFQLHVFSDCQTFLSCFLRCFSCSIVLKKVSLVVCHELAAAEYYRVLPAKAEVEAIVTVASDALSIPGD